MPRQSTLVASAFALVIPLLSSAVEGEFTVGPALMIDVSTCRNAVPNPASSLSL